MTDTREALKRTIKNAEEMCRFSRDMYIVYVCVRDKHVTDIEAHNFKWPPRGAKERADKYGVRRFPVWACGLFGYRPPTEKTLAAILQYIADINQGHPADRPIFR